MNVQNDPIVKVFKEHRQDSESQARSGLSTLNWIEDASIGERERCVAALMVIDGKRSDEIQNFIAKKENEWAEKEAKKSLNARGRRVKDQWEGAGPEMCRELKKEGKFYQMLLKAQERAFQVFKQARENGATCDQADKLAYQEVFLPEGQRKLGESLLG